MSTTRAELIQLIDTKIQDQVPEIAVFNTRGLSSVDTVSKLIDTNAAVVSKFIPRLLVEDIVGNGTRYIKLSGTVTAWNEESSKVHEFIYDYTDDTEIRSPYPSDLWEVVPWVFTGSTFKALFFKTDTPDASTTLRMTIYNVHDFSATLTLDDSHVDAFSSLIAGLYILSALAPLAFQNVKDTTNADAVSPTTPAADAARMGKVLIRIFATHVGLKDMKTGGVTGSTVRAEDQLGKGVGKYADNSNYNRKWFA